MAIFGFKKRKDEKLEQGAVAAKGAAQKPGARKAKPAVSKAVRPIAQPKAVKSTVPALSSGVETSAAAVIIRPRVTEKSGVLAQGGVYTFEVATSANKDAVSRAVRALYKVSPIRIAIINTPTRNVFVKGRRGTVPGIKKAIVTVKKGDKIDFV